MNRLSSLQTLHRSTCSFLRYLLVSSIPWLVAASLQSSRLASSTLSAPSSDCLLICVYKNSLPLSLFFKVFIEFYSIVSILWLVFFFFFGQEACGILAPQPGIETTPPVLEGEVLATGPPGKSLCLSFVRTFVMAFQTHVIQKKHPSSRSFAESYLCHVR